MDSDPRIVVTKLNELYNLLFQKISRQSGLKNERVKNQGKDTSRR
jgi:hypothetical protein